MKMKTNELKSADLRIGNFVKSTFDGLICEILDIYAYQGADVYCSNKYGQDLFDVKYGIEPILLTEEFFLKNGFEKDPIITQYYKEIDEFLISYIDGVNGRFLSIQSKKSQFYKYGIKYIHELQNAYYCLTGQELEIEL